MIDWDDAFDNSGYVPGAAAMLERWTAQARAVRVEAGELDIAYGPGARNRLDLFRPEGTVRGLAVFVHGGYWHMLDKNVWSHFATGCLPRGWALAVPGYTLAPEMRIGEIVREIAAAVSFAAELVPGPVRLIGHSAGGHLVSRMACEGGPVPGRLERVVSVSGIHDLRPLLGTRMNEILQLDTAEAEAESPALRRPRDGLDVRFWCGACERPELLRQTRLISEAWAAPNTFEPDHDHFTIIEGLGDPGSPLTEAFLGAPD
ncbi:Alpha/beta hydrolase family protein [Cribrihabitans marinus]|uniref:Alpha/beta hydrolase family protein n=1 Tax=Cribrihabitans marinus TaxID=1227549 RepID=A0A1H7BL96_9RHOB|nr:alpha/beta hydrolase [Cribrihabitans marinus]GGH34244.1 esterase [Cribrihabitans marinus]SEJ78391.1 Alpha/beta hydrolase family protein [Cribrihabitans marinus]